VPPPSDKAGRRSFANGDDDDDEEDGEEEPHTDGGDDEEVEIAIASGTPATAVTGQKTIPWCIPRTRKKIECP
jgi:hypothetical protein